MPETRNHLEVFLSVVAPHVQLATDGKEPSLAPFSEAITEVLRKACGMAYRAMHRPGRGVSIKDAACSVMETAYWKASGGGQYPANARQIMYAARPEILRLTGKDKLDDAYFTQVLLPDYVTEHGKETEWDVVFDSRGSFIEPHTGRDVALGTIDVRTYLGGRPALGAAFNVTSSGRYPTIGPEHRYATVLFIEKEGFAPLLQAARIAERFDMAIMSTKGMSTTAARLLLDRLAPQIDKVLVLHDFDVSGFSIFGTLSTDGRRYTFDNDLPIVDIGLRLVIAHLPPLGAYKFYQFWHSQPNSCRTSISFWPWGSISAANCLVDLIRKGVGEQLLRLADIKVMGLQSEPVETPGSWEKRAGTLAEHGATESEIACLRSNRVELNAMPADVFVSFLERKLAEHGVCKIVPDNTVLERHARRVIEQRLAEKVLDERRAALRAQATAAALPDDIGSQVRAVLVERPELSWDLAVSALVAGDVT